MTTTGNSLTTSEVARICKVSPRTVCKWFDSGRLRGFRMPGSQERRIPREYLIAFLQEHGMPVDELLSESDGQMKSRKEQLSDLWHDLRHGDGDDRTALLKLIEITTDMAAELEVAKAIAVQAQDAAYQAGNVACCMSNGIKPD